MMAEASVPAVISVIRCCILRQNIVRQFSFSSCLYILFNAFSLLTYLLLRVLYICSVP